MDEIVIASRDYWFKVIDMLQQNWALADTGSDGRCVVYFIGDLSGVFDRLSFPSEAAAVDALERNGFGRYADAPDFQAIMAAPQPPFDEQPHPNGLIYSSGRFWR